MRVENIIFSYDYVVLVNSDLTKKADINQRTYELITTLTDTTIKNFANLKEKYKEIQFVIYVKSGNYTFNSSIVMNVTQTGLTTVSYFENPSFYAHARLSWGNTYIGINGLGSAGYTFDRVEMYGIV